MNSNDMKIVGLFLLVLAVGCSKGEESDQELARQLKTLPQQHLTAFRPEEKAPQLSFRPLVPVAEPYIQVWTVKETASDALGRIGEAAVPALIDALAHPDPELAKLLKTSQLQHGQQVIAFRPQEEAPLPSARPLVPLSEPYIQVWTVKETASDALGRIG